MTLIRLIDLLAALLAQPKADAPEPVRPTVNPRLVTTTERGIVPCPRVITYLPLFANQHVRLETFDRLPVVD